MKLKEVAELMGVSERTVRNYSAAGKLTPAYVPGKTSPVAEFDESQVKALKDELSATLKPERLKPEAVKTEGGKTEAGKPEVGNPESRNSEAEKPELGKAELGSESNQLAVIPRFENFEGGISGFSIEQLPALVQALANVLVSVPSRDSLARLPLLTFAEAAELTGLSEKILRDAARSGELLARKIGRAQRIRQNDLNRWIDERFE